MKTIIRLCCFTLLMNTSVYAEVITDGSLGSATTLSGQMDIPQSLGTTVGNNLFHSFNTFNINTGESATFTGDNALKNVISRVTGGQFSTIDGLLQSTIGTANFYFINPAGVTFGVNAQIDVPAAFYMSTADTLRFSDGSQFSASNLAANRLSIAEPTGFGFINNQGGNIEVQGSVLDFKDASTVGLSAHNVIVNNGWLTSPSGHIQVYATGDTATELPINAPPTNTLTGRIELTAASSLDTSTDRGGKITLQGGDIVIRDGSSVTADTLTGNAAGVSVKSNNLSLLNGGRIGSDTSDTGNAGNITVDVNTLVVDGQGGNQFTAIASDTLNDVIANAGNAGAVSIKANNLTVANGGQISSDTWGSGHAANVAIDATNLLVDGQGNGAWISSNSNNDQITNAGNAGNVSITGASVSVLNHGQISSDAWGTGHAGSINIQANDVVVDGQGSNQFTGIASNTNNDLLSNAGNAGAVSIKTNSLSVSNAGQIVSDTWGSGQAGNIAIDAATISVDGQALISSSSRNALLANAGNAGTINLKANNLSVLNKGQLTTLTSGTGHAGNILINSNDTLVSNGSIHSNTDEGSTGNAGSVFITGTNLGVSNSGQISSDTLGSGNAGNIALNATTISVDGQGVISSSSRNALLANAGNAGTINLKANSLAVANKGQVTTLTTGTGHAGNIIVNSNDTLISNGSIHSDTDNGSTGNAGSVLITGNNLAVSNGGQISSDTLGLGNAGNIALDTATISVDGQGVISSSSRNSVLANAGNAGSVIITSDTLTALNNGHISSDTAGSGNGGNVNLKSSRSIVAQDGASISSSTSGAGRAGNIVITAPVITVDNATISAEANAQSQGQTGNINVTASKAIYLANHGKVSLKNAATIANTSNIIPSSITVSAPDIDLKDSEITTAATGNVDAGNININFSHWLTLDPSFISTTANTGNGGTITIQGGQLIRLQNSGFLTSVSGANSNGGNINVSAEQLLMDTGIIQANAVGGSGGDINLNLKALLTSQNRLILGGNRVTWQPFVSGLNVIQAASENGVSGVINVTSPQFDISASVSGLDSAQLVMPTIDRNLCQSSAMLGSSLARGGQGGIPADETRYSYIPIATENPSATPTTIATAKPSILSGESFPCARLQP